MTTKEFEKQTLEQLLIDLKDIDNYKSFRKGTFVYDLGHYQGQLLLQEINRLNNIIDEFDKWLIGEKMMFYKSDDGERLIRFGETKNKWLELKGDNK